MHGGVGHKAQVDPEAELVGGEILGQGHVGPAASGWLPSLVRVPLRFEVTGELILHVFAADALVVHPVGHAVDRNFNLSYVGVEVAFRVPGTGCVGVDEQKQDALERPALWVHPKVEAGVRASCYGHHPFAHDTAVRELVATAVRAERLVGEGLASNDLVLKLDVFQLVSELAGVRAVYHLAGWGEGQFEDQVVVKGMRVEDSVVGKDVVVQVDAVLGAVDTIQGVFRIHTAGLLVARARANFAQIHALDALGKHVSSCITREEEVLEDLVDVVPIRVLHRGGGKLDSELVNQGPRHVLHEIVVCVSTGDFEVDVEHERKRARDDDLFLRKLGHVDVQGLPRVGLRGVEGDALHSPLGLHGAEHFLRVRGE